jgi:hypothetical protein
MVDPVSTSVASIEQSGEPVNNAKTNITIIISKSNHSNGISNNISRTIIKYKRKRGPKVTRFFTTSTVDESSSSARLGVSMNFQHPGIIIAMFGLQASANILV